MGIKNFVKLGQMPRDIPACTLALADGSEPRNSYSDLEMLGKLVHIGFDVILISAFLAGIKRSTGLT